MKYRMMLAAILALCLAGLAGQPQYYRLVRRCLLHHLPHGGSGKNYGVRHDRLDLAL